MSALRRPHGLDAVRVSLAALVRRAQGRKVGSYRAQAERLLDLDARRANTALVHRFRGLLVHAGATVPHYREAFQQAGFQPHRFTSMEQLVDVPELSKLEFRSDAGGLRSSRYRPNQLVEYRTGGTSGAPVSFAQTRRSLDFKDGCIDALQHRMGWLPGHRAGYLWGASQDGPTTGQDVLRRIKRAAETWIDGGAWMTVGAVDDTQIRRQVDVLRDFQPDVVQAYPSVADGVAKWMLAHNEYLSIPRFLLSAEPTYDDQRARVSKAFGTEVYTFYGAREIGWIALECEQEHRLHVNTAGVYVEETPDGRLLVTDLINDAMPLIRYEVGDRGRMAKQRCACGDPRPVIDTIEGRIGDNITLPSGKFVPLPLIDVYNRSLRRESVLEAQLVQTAPERLAIRYVEGANFTAEHVQRLREALALLFEHEINVTAERVTQLTPEPNGKVRWCVAYKPEASA